MDNKTTGPVEIGRIVSKRLILGLARARNFTKRERLDDVWANITACDSQVDILCARFLHFYVCILLFHNGIQLRRIYSSRMIRKGFRSRCVFFRQQGWAREATCCRAHYLQRECSIYSL